MLYDKPVFKEKKQELSKYNNYMYNIAHIQGITNLQNTAQKFKSVTLLSTPQQALWPMHIDQQTPSNF